MCLRGPFVHNNCTVPELEYRTIATGLGLVRACLPGPLCLGCWAFLFVLSWS